MSALSPCPFLPPPTFLSSQAHPKLKGRTALPCASMSFRLLHPGGGQRMGSTVLQAGWGPYLMGQGSFIQDFQVLNNNQQPLSQPFELRENKPGQQWEGRVPVLPQIIAFPCFHPDQTDRFWKNLHLCSPSWFTSHGLYSSTSYNDQAAELSGCPSFSVCPTLDRPRYFCGSPKLELKPWT